MITFSIIQKSQLEGAMRLDAEYYNPAVRIDFSKGSWNKVSDVLDFIQYGTSEDLNEDGLGFPTLRLNEFDDVFIEKPQKYCNRISEKIAQELELKKEDVLICRTNGNPKLVGKSAIVMDDNEYIFASYLFRVRTKKNILNSASLVTYLNSRIGRGEIERFSLTSNQTNFSPATLREIRIPVFSKEFQEMINQLIVKSFELHEQSKSLYQQSEGLFLEELGLENFNTNQNLFSVVNLSDVQLANRMDAEYFQGKFRELLKIISKNSKLVQLKDVAEIKRGSLINPNFYDSRGIPYLRGGDFSSGRIGKDRLVYINKKFVPNNETIVNTGDIVFASIGSVGTLALVKNDFNGSFISNNTAKISINKKNEIIPDYLDIILQSVIGKLQFEKESTQTAQPKISDSQVKNFLIPVLPKEIQKKISDLVCQSHEARKKAKELLEEAKRKVEEIIEKGGKSDGNK